MLTDDGSWNPTWLISAHSRCILSVDLLMRGNQAMLLRRGPGMAFTGSVRFIRWGSTSGRP
jgi:hypothetical protein